MRQPPFRKAIESENEMTVFVSNRSVMVDRLQSFIYRQTASIDLLWERSGNCYLEAPNRLMAKQAFIKKQLPLYAWIGLAYLVIWLIHNLVTFPGSISVRVLNNIWRAVYITGANLFFYEYLFPWVGHKRTYLIYNILLALLSAVIVLMMCFLGLYIWRQLGVGLHIYTPLINYPSLEKEMAAQTYYGIMSVLFFGVIRHFYNYFRLQASAQQLRIEKQEAELNYLKSQTNPHFLFNTLNNIYSLAREKSDLAPESILRLSKILRFMLYEAGGPYIAIGQELKIISDYIALEQLRYDDSLRIDFNHDIEDARQSIPPLLLIPLVENAFKHGVSETRSQPFVSIHLSVSNRQLLYVVKNSVEEGNSETALKEQIGISNLRRQLELLYMDYALTFEKGNTSFTARLTINLSSHV
ncbi:MAG TPA: histidine kinase [Flavisolibacter sp.]|nr:histidine kinase [Flavisolibacter sp.]